MQSVPFTPHPQATYEMCRLRRRTGAPGPRLDAADVVATVQRMINGGYERWHQERISAADRIRNDAAVALGAAGISRGPSCQL